MVNGQQYFIPWDWGYASILYRTDKVDAADATGWELFWNEKYKGRISMWDGAQSNSRSRPSSSDSRRWTTRPPSRFSSRRKR